MRCKRWHIPTHPIIYFLIERFGQPLKKEDENMPAFFEYLRNITYYLVLMSLVGVLAPSGNYKKYITLIMGIVLIGLVVSPAASLLGRTPVPMTEIFGNIMPAPAENVDSGLRELFHSQLTTQTEALLRGEGYQLISADWETSDDFTYIRQVFLTVRSTTAGEPERIPFIQVKPVRITQQEPEEHPLKKLISDFYEMSKDNIHVNIQES